MTYGPFGRPDAEFSVAPERVRFVQMCRMTSGDAIPTFVVKLAAPVVASDKVGFGSDVAHVEYFAPSAGCSEIWTFAYPFHGNNNCKIWHDVVGRSFPHLHRIDSPAGITATMWVDDAKLHEIWLMWAQQKGDRPQRAVDTAFELMAPPQWAQQLREAHQVLVYKHQDLDAQLKNLQA